MALDNRYFSQEVEKKWQEYWKEKKIFAYNKNSKKEVFSIDTPPPTVSGKLHIGHVFSYTQAEIIARYQRMLGKNVMYPFGFDDNGLPTEILTEKETGVSPKIDRKQFQQLCLQVSAKYREEFKKLWQNLGFSCDWEENYSTISPEVQRISQRSFLDLYKKDALIYREMPTIWSTKTLTTIAQAEIEDINKGGTFNYLNFRTVAGEAIPIATTRPELLSSCVAMFIHPENKKYTHLIGQEAIVPLYNNTVKILADEKADPEKGTGIVMCCTFGDVTDIDWWREHNLEMKISITPSGKMNERAGEFEGLEIEDARKAITQKLLDEGFIYEQEEISADNRIVNVHERTGVPIEFINVKQWFIRVMDYKEELIKIGEKINWYPEYMYKRYVDWVGNLSWDWSISRQRYSGVPIPVWYDKEGKIYLPDEDQLPVDPIKDRPNSVPKDLELIPETDVLDTWATSSSSPEINSHWGEGKEDKKLRPMSMRPQAHDIIRTWAFYTIVKSYFHFNDIPWKDIVISGHVVKSTQGSSNSEVKDVQGKQKRKNKISKSKDGNNYSPTVILEKFGADCIRYWASSGTLGTDIAFNEEEISGNDKLLTKLWNSSRFAEMFLVDFDYSIEIEYTAIDKWALAEFNKTIKLYHQAFEKNEFYLARVQLEKFFWQVFCDNYLEFIKERLYQKEKYGDNSHNAAKKALAYLLLGQIKLFAPFIPHITEEIYQNINFNFSRQKSLHIEILPSVNEAVNCSDSTKAGDLLLELVKLVRIAKSKYNYSMRLPIDDLCILSDNNAEGLNSLLDLVRLDLKFVANANNITFVNELDKKENSSNEHYIEASPYSMKMTMNQEALERNLLIAKIKPEITKIKQSLGLKSKTPVKNFYLDGDVDVIALLKTDLNQAKSLARAENLYFEKHTQSQSIYNEKLVVFVEK